MNRIKRRLNPFLVSGISLQSLPKRSLPRETYLPFLFNWGEDLSASGGFIRLWRIYPPLEDPAIGAPPAQLNFFCVSFNRGRSEAKHFTGVDNVHLKKGSKIWNYLIE
jgi:hypothetical protein